MVINWDINSKLHSMKELQKYFLDFKRLRPYYYGDYYPLTGTESMLQDNVWIAYQLNRQEQGDGIITAFRRENCNDKSLTVRLRGVDPKVNYELIDEDSQVRILKTGEELMKGFALNLNEKPGSLVIMYKKTQ
jgi:alpha-galactosidase